MDNPAALYRLRVGVPATVEHATGSTNQGEAQTAKWVAETTQVGFSRQIPSSLYSYMVPVLHQLYGCDQTQVLRKGSALSYATRTNDRICSFQK